MKINRLLNIFIISSSLLLWNACRPHAEKNELAHDHEHEHEHAHEHGHHHEHDGELHEEEEDAIVISPEKSEKLGIVAEVIEPEPFTESIKVGGQITAPPSSRKSIVAKTSGIVNLKPEIRIGSLVSSGESLGTVSTGDVVGSDAIKTLQVEFESTKKELDRLTPLYEQGIVSAKDYNAAKTAYEKAKAAMGNITAGSGVTLVSPISGTLINLAVNNGEYVEAGKTIGYVGDNANLTLRADLPKRYHAKFDLINDAYIIPSCGDCEGFLISDFNGKKLDGNISTNENISGFLPVYFSFKNNGSIDGNSYVETYLQLEETKEQLAVPNQSLIEQQGEWFVFVKLDEDCYDKRPVKIGGSNGRKTVILAGIEPGEEVVVKGVSFVKLAENAGAVPESHSHSH